MGIGHDFIEFINARPPEQSSDSTPSSSKKEDAVPSFAERFPEVKKERTTLKVWATLLVFGLALVFLSRYVQDAGWLVFVFGVLAVVACIVWLYMSITKWGKDYEEDRDGLISPGPTYKYSLSAGKENDPYIDLDNRLRSCFMAISSFPAGANSRNFKWSCVEIDASHIVFEFYIKGVYGGYEFLKKEKDRLAVEFGDPDGADLKKTGEGRFELLFDKLDGGTLDAGVVWGDSNEAI